MTLHLITGVNGFIGGRLSQYLQQQGIAVRGTVRDNSRPVPPGVEPAITGSIDGATDWSQSLAGVEVVYHLASTVHRPDIQDPAVYQATITAATATLATHAAKAGVKRLILLSTASVYGAEAMPGILKEQQEKHPVTLYGQAKLAAEIALQNITQQTGLATVIVRPPMVYGKGAPGNFNQLVKLIQKVPLLPFGSAHKKRSFIGIDNLLAFLLLCAEHTEATGRIFNISDDADISLRELTQAIATVLKKSCLLCPVPPGIMRVGLNSIGKESVYNKLFESFRLDVDLAKTILDWKPLYTVQEQLQRALSNIEQSN